MSRLPRNKVYYYGGDVTEPTIRSAASVVEVSWPALMRLVDLARRAGLAILACKQPGHERKADGSPVTSADRAAQDIICADLHAWDPAIPIAAEESPLPDSVTRRTWRRYWLVDPLDGTKEFLAGRPEVTVNIALVEDGEPVMGVVFAPFLSTIYYAARGLGTWRQERDGAPVRLHGSTPTPGVGVRLVESRSHPSPELEDFVRRVPVAERIAMGSSLKFCWLAEGWADCYPRFGPTMAWDVAAGDCVFRHATAGEQPHRSPLAYDPAELKLGPFVIGHVPGFPDGYTPDR
jgi:3'(2'), 5'-bisphosphate nucleotidase